MSRVYKRSIYIAIGILCCLYLISNVSESLNAKIKNQFFETFTPQGDHTKNTDNNALAQKDRITPPEKQNNAVKDGTKQVEKKEEVVVQDACTVTNPLTHGFIDLRELSSISNEGKSVPWVSKGYDSGHNFTLGICSNPFRKLHQNEMKDDVNSTMVGGYYIDQTSGKYISIGEFSETPVFRGRKLTLTYSNGSYCDNLVDSVTGERLRKSSILTFTCDREMQSKASVSFVGSANDCSYFFEVRSVHACPTAHKADNLAAIWIFLFIFLAALFVYFSGGLLYKQMKHHKQKRVNI